MRRSSPRWRRSRIDQVSLECRNARVPMALMRLLAGKDVLVGVIDVATDRVETPEEVADTIAEALAFVPAGAAVSLHQLRHGADAARHRGGEAGGARCRGGLGTQQTGDVTAGR